ncbi:MAG: hypothetical protein AB8F95_14630 [Bacteroidia bacterium]
MANEQKAPAKAGFNWKTPAIHAGIILAFIIVLFGYFKPITNGMTLQMGDINKFSAMSAETREYQDKDKEPVFWTNAIFSGMPTTHLGLRYEGNIFSKIKGYILRVLPRPLDMIFLLFVGFYLLLNVFKVGPWISGLGAMMFAFSSYWFIIMAAGHTSKAVAMGFVPLVAAGVFMVYERKQWILGSVIMAASLALQLSANHFQITYYAAIMLGAVGIGYLVQAIRTKTLPDFAKYSGALIVGALLAVGPNYSLLATNLEYTAETMRGAPVLSPEPGEKATSGLGIDYAFAWSYGKTETLSLLIPNIHGGASATKVSRTSNAYKRLKQERLPTYWGDVQFTSGPVYVGAIVFFLFVLSLLVVKGPLKWGLLAATIISIILAWGNNFMLVNEILFNLLPFYNKFRAPSMALVIAEFTIPLLGILGLHRILQTGKEGQPSREWGARQVLNAGAVTVGLCVVTFLMGLAFFDFVGASDMDRSGALRYDNNVFKIIKDLRVDMLQGDVLRSLLLVAAGAGLLWLYLKGTIKSVAILLAGLAVLTFGDQWMVNKRYLNDDNFARSKNYAKPRPKPASQQILQDKDPHFRTLNFYGGNLSSTFNDSEDGHFHHNIGGYHPAKLQRYQDLIGRRIQPEMSRVIQTLQARPSDSAFRATMGSLSTLNMLNTRYFIISADQQPVRNVAALGNGWFVDNVQKVNTADEEMAAISSASFNPATTAILGSEFADAASGIQGGGSGSIQLASYHPNKLVYKSNNAAQGLAVFSEMWYRGNEDWKAYIDGEYQDHIRVNYALRGLVVPAGDHEIVFEIKPPTFYTAETISMITSIVLLLALLGMTGWTWWKDRQNG